MKLNKEPLRETSSKIGIHYFHNDLKYIIFI